MSIATELRLVEVRGRRHRQAAMSADESVAQGVRCEQWLRSRARTKPRSPATRTVNGKGAGQRREVLQLSTRSKSSKGRNTAGSPAGVPANPCHFGGTEVGEPEGRVHAGNRESSRYDRNAVNLGSEIGLQDARGCRKPQTAEVGRNHESGA